MPTSGGPLSPLAYHHATKHQFGRFSPSLGYLDWATQPNPFRRFAPAELRSLPHEPVAPSVPYVQVWTGAPVAQPVTQATIGEFLRCALGLSAWKQAGRARWALRVNPSSGNLHPTEGYVVWDQGVWHYASEVHALERRAQFDDHAWSALVGAHTSSMFLVALSSIHWREAWKYGVRAFRYCQHDVGHALGALRVSAARLGWRMQLLPHWSHEDVAGLLGLDRREDFAEAEPEEPDCIAIVWAPPGEAPVCEPAAWTKAARHAVWTGTANRLSPSTVEWSLIDDVARVTRHPGTEATTLAPVVVEAGDTAPAFPSARDIILQRRSATAFDTRGVMHESAFFAMLQRVMFSREAVPWDVPWWPPHVHLVLFVHRVQHMTPGVYACVREEDGTVDAWRSALRPEFLWEPIGDSRASGLFLLAPLDVRAAAQRLACDQEIARDGFFSLGMVADLSSLDTFGPSHYRRLYWECGLIGQVLYLEAEAAGARATGIGCFYDDPVHEALGLRGERWQSLYHLAVGLPVEDERLTTEPGYRWER